MVLLIFRLSKSTTTSATFILGKTLRFSKLVFKGFNSEGGDSTQPNDGLSQAAAADLPIYLECSLFGDNEVCFYQGKNATSIGVLASAIGNLIPLGGVLKDRESPFRAMNLTIIDQPTSFAATKTISFKIHQIHDNAVVPLTSAQAFGEIVDNNEEEAAIKPIDHGINLYFEATTLNGHDEEQSFAIADSS